MCSYSTPVAEAYAEIVAKRSRFLAVIAPAGDADAAREVVSAQRTAHPKARHHCSAFIVTSQRLSYSDDDGEPSGTAGGPMLAVLDGAGLLDAVAVVTRYFGGTLLGTGGLTRAYSSAVRSALDAAELARLAKVTVLSVTADYPSAARIENAASAAGWPVLDAEYGADVVLRLGVVRDDVDRATERIRDLSAGAAQCVVAGSRYVTHD